MRVFLCTLVLLGVFLVTGAVFDTAPAAQVTGGLGAGPRLGNISVAEVTVPGRADVDAIARGGYDVDNVRGLVVTVYATDAELDSLRAAGYSVRVIPPEPVTAEKIAGYHTYEDLTLQLQNWAAAYPDICRLESLGKSVQNRDIWAMKITDNPDLDEDEPEFKYLSTIHGDEPVGMENCLNFIGLLLNGYGIDPRFTAIVNDTEVWIVPLVNPDGYVLGSRYNARGFPYDLNRLFPSYPTDFTGTIWDTALSTSGRQPEVAAIMQWSAAHNFVSSANFHGGALVVNYPYDEDGKPSGVDAPSPDDALFRDISRRYSIHNAPMWNSTDFDDGIVNGTAWYILFGGMQDWNYRFLGCNEVTIELGNTKQPAASALAGLWIDNQDSMLAYLEAVQIGVRGVVTDNHTGAPLSAKVEVVGNAQPVYTDPAAGDYHRMLLPGTYTLHISAPGHTAFTASDIAVVGDTPTRLDVALSAISISTDINGSGSVDAVDVQLVINAVLGLSVAFNCDVDGGGVSSTDIQLVVNAALGI